MTTGKVILGQTCWRLGSSLHGCYVRGPAGRATCSMRHLTSEGLKGRGMASTSWPRSWVQYSNTRKMLHGI